MQLSKDQYRMLLFQPKHIDETAWLIARSFVTLNPVWKSFNVPLDKAFTTIRAKILNSAVYPFSFVVVDENDKIVACTLQQDISTMQVIQQNTKKVNKLEIMDFLGKVENELEGQLFSAQYVPGECIYCLYACVDPDLVNLRIASWLFHAAFVIGRIQGIKHYYSRVTSPVTLNMQLAIGGEISNSVTVSKPEQGLELMNIYLVHIELSKLKVNRALF